jgi:hypothetical protein
MTTRETDSSVSVDGGQISDKYLARASTWEWHNNGQIDVLGGDGTVRATLTEWQTTVFHAADGNTSVQEFLSAMAHAYDIRAQPVPDDLGPMLTGEITYLVDNLHAVQLWDGKADLPVEFEFAQSDLPIED